MSNECKALSGDFAYQWCKFDTCLKKAYPFSHKQWGCCPQD